MELTNEFRVELPVDDAWALVTDPERLVPCIPDAELGKVDDGEVAVTCRLTVGRTTARYNVTSSAVERDDAAHRVVVRAHGKESQGNGSAVATITATVSADGERASTIALFTEISFAGRFSRADVGQVRAASHGIVDGLAGAVRDHTRATALASGSAADATEAPDHHVVDRDDAADSADRSAQADADLSGETRTDTSAAPPATSTATSTPARGGPTAPSHGDDNTARAVAAVGIVALLLWLLRRRRS